VIQCSMTYRTPSTPPQPSLRDWARFTAKVYTDANGCWLWASTLGPNGYPYFSLKSVKTRAHRIAWVHAHPGESIDGLTIDHLCGITSCVNPEHLEAVTMWENTLRAGTAVSAVNARKTECMHGHPFDEANTGRQWNKRDKAMMRYCKECRRLGVLRRRAAQQ